LRKQKPVSAGSLFFILPLAVLAAPPLSKKTFAVVRNPRRVHETSSMTGAVIAQANGTTALAEFMVSAAAAAPNAEERRMSSNSHSLVAELPDFLTWRVGTDLVRDACSLYVRWTYNRLRACAERTDAEVFAAAMRLPKASQQRLLVAPQAFFLLASKVAPGAEEITVLRQFIRTEAYLCDQRAAYPARSWTALGDLYLPSKKPSALPARPRSRWSVERTYKAPSLGHIVLDAYSPHATVDYPPYFGDVIGHADEEVELIKRRIEESLSLIDSLSRTARLTVGSSTQVISIAKSPIVPGKTGSVSIRTRIGRMGLVNLHTPAASIYTIANSIIHESIHSLIYKMELQQPLYTDQHAAHSVTTTSPWTGRSLQVHSFVHACFVWYGLLNFWSLMPEATPEVARLKARARRGFAAESLFSVLSREALEVIQPDVCEVIGELHRRVKQSGLL
jgi:hypothetical protein